MVLSPLCFSLSPSRQATVKRTTVSDGERERWQVAKVNEEGEGEEIDGVQRGSIKSSRWPAHKQRRSTGKRLT